MTGGIRILSKSVVIFIVLITLAISGACFPDSTLTIPLDPPKEQPKTSLELKHETTGATRADSQKKYSAQTTGKQAKKEVAIGRVGWLPSRKPPFARIPPAGAAYTSPAEGHVSGHSWDVRQMVRSSDG